MYNSDHFKEVEGCADVFNYHFTSFERSHDFKGVIYFYLYIRLVMSIPRILSRVRRSR